MTTNIKDYSTTQASNTSLNTIDVNEGMLPSNLNNAIRALMKNTRDWFNDSQWIEYGDGSGAYTAAYASSSSFTINGADVTSVYHAGRRIKLTAATPGTIFGTISSSSFSTNTTVNVTWDSGSLSSETISNVYISALSKTNSSIPTEIIGTTNIADSAVTSAKIATNAITTVKITDGNVTQAKLASDSVNGTKIADDSINSEHYVDASIDTAHIADSQITSAKIADGAIVNADVNASAAIDATKIHDGTISNTEFGHLNGVSSNIQTQLDAKGASNANLTAIGDLAKTDGNIIVGNGSTWVAENGATARTSLGLGTIATQAADSVSISGGSVTGLGSPSSNSDAATKSYVDNLVAGLRTRIIAECATTANVNLSNGLEAGDAIDGVTLVEGDRVLVKNQSTDTENGLYLAVGSGAGAASRDPEHDTIAELSGGMVVANQGSVNNDKIFLCTTDSSGSLGSTSITYTTITPQNVGDVTLNDVQTLTNKTLTTPKIGTSILDTNGNELAKLTATGSAVNEFTVANAATGGSPTLSATGGDSNIDLDLLAKGTGHVTVKGNTNSGAIQFNCESNSHGQIVIAQPHSAAVTNTLTLPAGASSTLVSDVSTSTLTNKTLGATLVSGTNALSFNDTGTFINSNADGDLDLSSDGTNDNSIKLESAGGVTIDANNSGSSGIIVLDAQFGGIISLRDGGTAYGQLLNSSSDFILKSTVSDKDLIFKGNDGGSEITALTFDMSKAGAATFNAAANVTQQALTSSSNAVAWDATEKPNAVHVTTENTTFSAPTNNVEGAFIALEINYNGSHTIAFNTIFEFAASTAPTFTSADGKTDILVFRYNGAVWQEVGRTLNLSES